MASLSLHSSQWTTVLFILIWQSALPDSDRFYVGLGPAVWEYWLVTGWDMWSSVSCPVLIFILVYFSAGTLISLEQFLSVIHLKKKKKTQKSHMRELHWFSMSQFGFLLVVESCLPVSPSLSVTINFTSCIALNVCPCLLVFSFTSLPPPDRFHLCLISSSPFILSFHSLPPCCSIRFTCVSAMCSLCTGYSKGLLCLVHPASWI